MINAYPLGMAAATRVRELEERIEKLERLVEKITESTNDNFSACAKRMTAQEIATGTRPEIAADHKDLFEEFGLYPQQNVRSKSDILMSRLIEKANQQHGFEAVYFTTSDVMRIFAIPDGQYVTARRIMESAAKQHPERVELIKNCKIGRKSATIIELRK